jgi:uncharacterized OsmC-like protein
VRAKEFHYDVTLEDGGRMVADETSPLEHAEGWKPDHYLVAALLRCTLESLQYHAERAGLDASGRASGHAMVTKRQSDERYGLVEISVALEVAVEPDPRRRRARRADRESRARLLRRRVADEGARLHVDGEREDGQASSGAIVRP